MSGDPQQFAFNFDGGEDGGDNDASGGSSVGEPVASRLASTTSKRLVKKKSVRPKPASTPEEALSVYEINTKIKQAIESSLSSLWVAGEITDIARPRSGHLYFTLKDERAVLRGVMWRSVAERLPFELDDGQSVLCYGDVEVYAARGSVQLVVRKCQPQGMGSLQLAFAQLQSKLEAEGLFAAERKRPLPRLPRKIAIVTSPSGAAIRDFLQAAAARHAGVEIVVIPSSVQGAGSVDQLIEGLKSAHRLRPRPDVLIVSRGGGSLEDLWSFNEERFVRMLAKSHIPTVSAVGHEIDVTLSDLVADVRALTPTDAASRVLPDREVLVDVLDALGATMRRSLFRRVENFTERLRWIESRPIFHNPMELIHERSRIVDDLDYRLRELVWRQWRERQHRLGRAATAVSALSPLSVLARGYSVTETEARQVIRSVDQVKPGDTLISRVDDGEIRSTVSSD
ncbi:exodeoxyribonuclease VII large subunit [Neorhodopirellula pilleata]|uniref:Exodeoxyribonuclease 7 large subunit n=1 Tax=Neorhodopirellula pilleata TaxID=2714738 RepID=A0A5C6AVH8_9BACT|nr:exodeoxyribonuclease VII large subunit [Neorhodopirellula pilleata]TWU03209.1 Exodeoxyribonuclease 7 large subunit [Neorhodopirellula pilleata]